MQFFWSPQPPHPLQSQFYHDELHAADFNFPDAIFLVAAAALLNSVAFISTQDDTDRAVVAERQVRCLQDALNKQELVQAITQPTKDVPSPEEFFSSMIESLDTESPSKAMQNFCANVLKKCADPSSGKGKLYRIGNKRKLNFVLQGYSKRVSKLSNNSRSRSRKQWVYNQALAVDKRLNCLPKADTYKGDIIRALANRSGLVVLRQSQVEMDIYEAIALRDHMESSTNAF